MKKQLPIGKSDFKSLIENGYYFVDKSLFVKEIIDSADVCLITRPRRFGKTINLSMLRYFYSNEADCSHLFRDLAISREGERYLGKQSKHPVIFLSFKDIKANTWEKAYSQIVFLIQEVLVANFRYLLDWAELNFLEKEKFISIQKGDREIIHYASFLKIVSKTLHRYHQAKTVILIDEYDTPIHAAYINGYYSQMIEFMRDFLSGGLKDNNSLEKGVITGIMRVAKESIFSGLNNLDSFTLLMQRMSEHFGFTEPEVTQLISDMQLPAGAGEEIRKWYNGYVFGEKIIYNPWSIIQYADKPEEGTRPYWVNTSDNALLKQLFFSGGANIKEELHELIQKRPLRKEVSETLFFEDLERRTEAVWTLLVFAGYLKARNMEQEHRARTYELSIPNEEVAYVYERFIKDWVREQIPESELNPMLAALTQGDVALFEDYFARFVQNAFSFHDTQASEMESFYHAFLLGLVASLQHDYVIKSNRESGLGRYDLMLAPKNRDKTGIVIEIKRPQKRRNQSLQDALQIAREQLVSNHYTAELEEMGLRHILKLAIAVEGKKVLVEEVF